MASLTPTPKQQIYGSDGNPLVGGKIYTYAAGTTTPLATYTDFGAGTANTNPIILNSLGQANIWLGSSSYKFSVYTSADVLLYTVDNISAPLDSAGLATALSSPTPIGNTTPNTGAFTTLAATTGTITTVNSTTVNATTVNATTITATGTVTAETLTFEGGGSMTRPPELGIQSISASVAANALTITLNPTTLDFRSTTGSSGTVTPVTLSTAVTLVVPSGATLGTVSGNQSQLIVLAINNAGTIELAVVNISGGAALNDGVVTTTAISAGSSSNTAFYSTTARTDVAYRVVGYILSTQSTAGTWATAPSYVQGFGGIALTGLNSLGFGQNWVNLSSSRAWGTTYYNTGTKPIFVFATAQSPNAGNNLQMTIAGVVLRSGLAPTPNYDISISALVPPGASYVIASSGGGNVFWQELR